MSRTILTFFDFFLPRRKLTIILLGSFVLSITFFSSSLLILSFGMFIYMFGMDSIFSTSMSLAIDESKDSHGIAAGLFGTIEMMLGAITTFILAGFYSNSIGVMVSLIIVTS